MGHIFVSYSKKDIVYAEKLINALRREGFNPWLDIEGLGAGTHWQNRLQKQIVTCDAYILIMSRNAYHSRWVPDELVTAKSKNKPIFPLLLDDTELFLAIQAIQVEDVRGGKLPSEAFYQRLAAVTSRQKKAGQKINTVRLAEKARKQKADEVAEKASHYLSVLTSNVQGAIAVTSKISSNTYKSVTKSKIVKKISSRIKLKTRPARKKRSP